ncbi:MAG: NADH-quinone oxidoreductase subunit NuoF [Deltaproteobacteria bacterium]|jgi:NADH-quinone oxidoreductase subunit F|nr:NADH-quinone oxidoreductase subunit NuoF [Deltaproteobacteria bacterium]MBT4263787.1 NADH-quinone oxidoreductase subunit NuoF [Deltaproteobacteria bacterium]MBT4643314.1 NADH-quinone oxidoreductase subunit NuoF [Deltaproteobacteria bacterium]MBT7154648.1 NADH-quinone oxidoreductase subunit NuoF [Deltaproteobacteria bacterium]MBT7712680.1 NADH-quinone oxidoreductase subunit NuoF [Deltaproteobacteria bacterium]
MDTITIGTGTCGVSAGAEAVLEAFQRLISDNQNNTILLAETGCMGMCYKEVLVEVKNSQGEFLYGDVTPDKAAQIFQEHLLEGHPLDEWLVLQNHQEGNERDFILKQHRIVLRNCGLIDPMSIDDYLSKDGYKAITKALMEISPEELIQSVIDSGLRGRGGAGFLTGIKWRFARQSPGKIKYVICNADEGDPGAFMDRSVLEGDPHSVLEGMLLCGYAIGASTGYIYCRAEYPRAIIRLENAIKQAEERRLIGENVLGSGWDFKIKIKEGAGAFVCGEETALIASIEGHRGTPRIRPPYPAAAGLWGKPTNINNVETLANLPWIVQEGPQKYAELGTEHSKGTKVFAMAGKIKRSGLVEVPMGISINEIVFDICGGIKDGKKFKAVQMGGPSGGCIPASLGETLIDYQQINKTGAIMGSGGMIVVDDSTCMVELARFFLEFTQNESCGKCTSCRIGTLRMLEILDRIIEGKGEQCDLDQLEELGHQIKNTSQCGLGQTAPNPVLTTLNYFREEYEAHVQDKCCPAHSCSALVNFMINSENCTGCMICTKDCPVGAISGEKKQVHFIDQEKCIKCGKCITTCNFNAVYKD